MKLLIDPRIFELFPDTSIGVLVATGINNRATPDLTPELTRAENKARDQFADTASLTDHPTIQSWRKAYKQFKAGDDRCSVESLTKRILKGNSLPRINPLVDLYNTISLLYTLPVGGEDLDHITGNIRLTIAEGDEEFLPLGTAENKPPEQGEIVYKDDRTVLCRKWNWRESERTKLTDRTTRAMFVIESLLNEEDRIAAALAEYAHLLRQYCGASAMYYTLDKFRPSAIFDS